MVKVRKIKTSNTDHKIELPEEAGKSERSLRNAEWAVEYLERKATNISGDRIKFLGGLCLFRVADLKKILYII